MKNMRIYYLACIVLLASLLRLWQLGIVPPGITNDEAGVFYGAYTLIKTGRDLSGNFLPLSFAFDNTFPPVPIYLTAPFVGLLGPSAFAGRLPFALIGIATVVVLYLLVIQVFRSRTIALLSALVLALSPWHIHMTRIGYANGIAVFLYLSGVYTFIRGLKTGNLLLSLFLFLLAFHSYDATKVYLILLLPALVIIFHKEVFARKKTFVLLMTGLAVIVGTFLLIMKLQTVTRQQVILFLDNKSAASVVNFERDKNTAPFWIRPVFNNKLLYFARVMRERYLSPFSPQFLFLYGETGGLAGIYGPYNRGVMYLIELPLLILGFSYLFSQKNRNARWLVVALMLLAPLPSAISVDESYAVRSSMMIPPLAIITAAGIVRLKLILERYSTRTRVLAIAFLIGLYGISVTSYLYQYYYRYPIYGAETWFKSSKDLSELLAKEKQIYQNVSVVDSGIMYLLQYGIYNRPPPDAVQAAWQMNWPKKIDNVTFFPKCIDTKGEPFNPSMLPPQTLYIVREECHREATPSSTIRELGEPLRVIWKIYQPQSVQG